MTGHYDFSGGLNITEFLRIAQEEDLYVLLRPGPYICAERDMGGLPFWLLKQHPDIHLRSSDARYTEHVEKWLDKLMPIFEPYLYGNGGPIILVQVCFEEQPQTLRGGFVFNLLLFFCRLKMSTVVTVLVIPPTKLG